MTLKCDCGDTLKDWRGARGHVQFSAGDGHGEKNSLPDGWKDLFSEVDDDGEPDDEQDDDSEPEEQPDDDGDDGSEQSPTEPEESNTDESGASDGGRLKRALFDDVRALWGGDK